MRGGGRDEAQLGLVKAVSAPLGRALTHLADLLWRGFFRSLGLFEDPEPTPEQLHQQRVREQVEARTEYQRKAREDR